MSTQELRDAFVDALARSINEGTVTLRELGIDHTTEITNAIRDLVFTAEDLACALDPDLPRTITSDYQNDCIVCGGERSLLRHHDDGLYNYHKFQGAREGPPA